MAWTSVNPVAVGNITKKSQYDAVFDNTVYLHDTVLGSPNSNSGQPLFTLRKNGSYKTTGTDGSVQFVAAAAVEDGASLTLYGETHATTAGDARIITGGDSSAASVGAFTIENRYTGGTLTYLTVENTGITIGQDSSGATLPFVNSQADGSMVIYGGTSATTGAYIQIEGDDKGGTNAGGNIIMRTGYTEGVVLQESAGYDRILFDLNSTDVYVDFLSSTGVYDDVIFRSLSYFEFRDSAAGSNVALIPEYATDMGGVFGSRKMMYAGGTETLVLPSSTVADGGSYATAAGASYFETDTRRLWIYDGGDWYYVALTAGP